MSSVIDPVAISKSGGHINIGIILATFAFTMLGFMAAVITILFSFSGSAVVRRYRELGRLNIFFVIYYLTIVTLLLTFISSIFCLVGTNDIISTWAVRISLMLTVNALIQIMLVTFIIINLSKEAALRG